MALLGNLTGSSHLNFQDIIGFYNGVATQSVRLDDGSSAYLTRTPSSASNRKTWTWSGWAKRATITTAEFPLLAANTDANNRLFFRFEGNLIKLYYNVSGTANEVVTVALYRDTSAWYHVVLAVDTTQGTDTNRIKIYVNGVQQTLTGTYIAENTDTQINLDVAQLIGKKDTANTFYDGYLSEVNFIDGLALTPTSFGEFKNGVWIPIDTRGLTFGTNGYRLKFDQVGVGTASTSTIGADTSGEDNHWTSSGIVASDCAMPDSPENNFPTWNPIWKSYDSENWTTTGSTSEGNLRWQSASGNESVSGIVASFELPSSGKWYWENHAKEEPDSSVSWVGIIEGPLYANVLKNAANTANKTFGDGDIISCCFDADNQRFYSAVNNTFIAAETVTDTSDGQAATGSGYLPYCAGVKAGTAPIMHVNFGQDSTFGGDKTAGGNADANGIGDFYYAPPSGYLALCSANLPEPTIGANSDTQADDHFNTVLFTGNGGTKAVTGLGFQPDWFWGKSRTNPSGVYSHSVYDSSRGVTKRLLPDLTNAESTTSGITSFDADGFTLGSNAGNNNNNATYVNWCWKANGGTTSSNSDGSITSTVQANTDAGFSIVTYTGNGSNATVGHGLSSAPDMFVVKNRTAGTTGAWLVYHSANTSAPETDYLRLNGTEATADINTVWNDTAPTSSVFSIGTSSNVNTNTHTYLAYCFHSVEGFSKFGSYTGNGNADGTFVYVGFKPAYVMIKKTSGTGSWNIIDLARGDDDAYLSANLSNAEGVMTNGSFELLSNGFKLRNTFSEWNASGSTYIYMAFAEAPFKYANAR